MSSADPGGEDQPTGKPSSPPAEAVTDPALRAEVDNPAEANVPTGAEAAPGDRTAAADDPPLPAPGAPDELSSDQTPSQGREVGSPAPDGGPAEVAGGDAGAPESGPASASPGDVVPAEPVGSAAPEGGATVPDQPEPTASAVATGRALAAEARSEQASEAAAAEDAGPSEPPAEPADLDAGRQDLVEGLSASLDGGVVDHHVVAGVDVWVRVDVDHWHRAFEVCRDQLGLTYFDFLSAVDWLPSPYGRSEDAGGDGAVEGDDTADVPAPAPAAVASGAELEHGITGGSTRFQLLARLASPTSHLGLTLKADVDDDAPRAPTVSDVFPGADWHERETWEMYGIDFTGHPNLVHIYLPGAFEGHPQRKDFPLLAREVKPWPGLVDVEAMPGEPDAAAS